MRAKGKSQEGEELIRAHAESRRHILSLLLLAAVAAIGATMLMSRPTQAYVSPPCHAEANGAPAGGGSTNGMQTHIVIDGQDEWDVGKDWKLSGFGTAPTPQKSGSADAVAFGFGLVPIASGSDPKGKTRGEGSLDVSAVSDKARVIAAAGSSDDCSGFLTVVVKDESAFDTAAGKVSAGVGGLGFLGLLWMLLRRFAF